MSIEGQSHFFTIYFPGFVCFVLYKAMISGECLQDHWSSGSSKECEIFTSRELQKIFLLLNHVSEILSKVIIKVKYRCLG